MINIAVWGVAYLLTLLEKKRKQLINYEICHEIKNTKIEIEKETDKQVLVGVNYNIFYKN